MGPRVRSAQDNGHVATPEDVKTGLGKGVETPTLVALGTFSKALKVRRSEERDDENNQLTKKIITRVSFRARLAEFCGPGSVCRGSIQRVHCRD